MLTRFGSICSGCCTRRVLGLAATVASLGLFGCGGVRSVTIEAGSSPFISFVHLQGFDVSRVAWVQYTIAPKPGSISKPVHVEYAMPALFARGYLSGGSLTVPVFGLYPGYINTVSLELRQLPGDPISLAVSIPTPAYADPSGIYSHPNIVTPRAPGSSLGFDFIFIKSGFGSPIIIDTDGEIRWAVPGFENSTSSVLDSDGFNVGSQGTPTVDKLRLDGSVMQGALPPSPYIDFNHDIDQGKYGFLAEVDASSGGVESLESNVIEFQDSSAVSILNQWDLGAILTAYMSSQGDNPAAFVRPGVDWFHSNSAIYDPSDDTIIVSSRENFVIKLDYKSGTIIWILGDPTKYWYTFPSLRAKALTLAPGGLYPVGQHALSITSEGLLMLFNDGLGSLNQPAGEPAGEFRGYSTVSAYSINKASMTAAEVWDYDAGATIYSAFCSSAYEAGDQSILVDYAVADNDTEALLVGLDSNHNVVFEFEYPTTFCFTSWNARPIPLDDFVVDQ